MPDLDSLTDVQLRELVITISETKTAETILQELVFFLDGDVVKRFLKMPELHE